MQLPVNADLDPRRERRAAMDALADGLLQLAIRHRSLSRDEAMELTRWDLATIAEYLALLLERQGLLSADDVGQLLAELEGPDH